MSGEQDDRHLAAFGGVQSADRICMAGPAGHQYHADLAGHARPGVSHVNRRALLANVDEFDWVIDGGVKHRHYVISGEGEDRPGTSDFQCFEQCVCSPRGRALHGDIVSRFRGVREMTRM
jgi:hypothetical protein